MQEEPAEAKVVSAEMVDMVEGTYFVCGVHVVLDAVENWYKQKHSADVTWEIHVMGQKCTKVWKKLIVHLSKFICWRQLSLCMLWTVWDVEKKVSEFTLLHILLYVCHNKILSAEVTVRCMPYTCGQCKVYVHPVTVRLWQLKWQLHVGNMWTVLSVCAMCEISESRSDSGV